MFYTKMSESNDDPEAWYKEFETHTKELLSVIQGSPNVSFISRIITTTSSPTNANDEKEKGNSALKMGNIQKAISHYTTAIQLEENNHLHWSNRSVAYAKLGKFEEALNDANKCIQIDPTFAKGFARKGFALSHLGKIHEAKAAYEIGLKFDPNSALIKEGIQALPISLPSVPASQPNASSLNDLQSAKIEATKLKDQGNTALNNENYIDAIEHYTKAITLDKDNHLLYSNRSLAFVKVGNWSLALDDASMVITLQPEWPKGYVRKGVALQGQGKFGEALYHLQKGLLKHPNDTTIKSVIDSLPTGTVPVIS